MAAIRRKKQRNTLLALIISLLIIFLAIPFIFVGCSWQNNEDAATDSLKALNEKNEDRDPLPSELVERALVEDSLSGERRDLVRENMEKVVRDYRKIYHEEYYSGYFTTDLDEDNVPELWVRVGNYRDNSRLELYYPETDGSLKKTVTVAEPGKYYIGKDYLIQVVTAGPGIVSVNKITIYRGAMSIENMHDIDFYSHPDAALPKFNEKPAPNHSLSNLHPLLSAF